MAGTRTISKCAAEKSPIVVIASQAMSNMKNLPIPAVQGCPEEVKNKLKEEALKLPAEKFDKQLLCEIMCCCDENPSISAEGVNRGKDQCVTDTIEAADKMQGYKSRYKSQVSFNMTGEEPTPFLHRDEFGNNTTQKSTYWLTRAKQEIENFQGGEGYVRRPDVVIVKDPNKHVSKDNIENIFELKFDDYFNKEQERAYEKIAGDEDKSKTIKCKDDCNCDGDGQEEPEPATVPEKEKKADTSQEPSKLLETGKVVGYTVLTVGLAVATVALALCPFDGPLGEAAAGTGTAAAGTRAAIAFRSLFSVGQAAAAL